METKSPMKIPKALLTSTPTTILAYGALLSEDSARLTFPHLNNFRLVRVQGLRRVFAHPHLFLISQLCYEEDASKYVLDDVTLQSLRVASLSAEYCRYADDDKPAAASWSGFVAAAFDVVLDDEQRRAFIQREPEYAIERVPYYNLSAPAAQQQEQQQPEGYGVICLSPVTKDDDLPSHLDAPRLRFAAALGMGQHSSGNIISSSSRQSSPSLSTVWKWPRDSGLLPADLYLRHVLLAVRKAGPQAEESFLKETFLVDRITTLQQYLSAPLNEASKETNMDRVMAARPPPRFKKRFNG